MAVLTKLAVVAVALFVAMPLTSCRTVDASDPSATAIEAKSFSKNLRDRYGDAVLVAEGRKVCDALEQGTSEKQVAEMITKDLGPDIDAPDFALQSTLAFCAWKAPG